MMLQNAAGVLAEKQIFQIKLTLKCMNMTSDYWVINFTTHYLDNNANMILTG